MIYEKYYPGGWQSGETGGTPITPEALNHMEDGILHSRPALESAEYPGSYYDLTTSGTVEWINPPLELGVEYRTTQVYNGRAVYMKLIDIGECPASEGKKIAHGIEGCRPIRCTGYARTSTVTIPYISLAGARISLAADATHITIHSTYSPSNFGNISVLLEYWKN